MEQCYKQSLGECVTLLIKLEALPISPSFSRIFPALLRSDKAAMQTVHFRNVPLSILEKL